MSWVFCPKCFIRPSQDNRRQFFITSCSHILCNNCTNIGDSHCRRCQTLCRMVLINNEMPDEVKDVFSDVSERAAMLIKAMEFQQWHRSRLMNHYRDVARKYDAAKLFIADIQDKFTTLQQKYETAKLKIKELESVVQDLNRKLSLYKKKYGSDQKTPRSSRPLAELDFEIPRTPRIPMNSATPIHHPSVDPLFTSTYSMYRNINHPSFTPESSGSVRSSQIGSLSSYSGRNSSLPEYTPPSKTMELLTLLNRSRSMK